MHTDCAVLTGAQHSATASPCQDYGWAQSEGDTAFALVADGCSTGGHTDLGARAWTLAARSLLQWQAGILQDIPSLQARLIEAAEPALRQLAFEDGFSTLLVLQAQGRKVHATFFGDGALLVRHRDGTRTLIGIDYTANAPEYLNYWRRSGVHETWEKSYAGQELRITTHRQTRDGQPPTVLERSRSVALGPWQWSADIEQDGVELVMVATDGVDARDGGLPVTGGQLLGVKNPAGEFLKRRLGKLARAWTEEATMPTDDLAVAGVWFGENGHA
jgi:hypothetical protein